MPVTAPSPASAAAVRGPSVPRYAWIAVLVVGAALFFAAERTLAVTGEPPLTAPTVVLGAATVPAAFLAFVCGRRLPSTVAIPLVVAAALLGGVAGTVLAGGIEAAVRSSSGSLSMAGVALIEEASKLLVPLAVLLLAGRCRTAADGLLLGVAAGAGFAALETMGYALATLLRSPGDVAGAVDVLVLRGVLSPAGHGAWTGIAATALFAAASSGWPARRIAASVGAFVLAVALHTAWDSPVTLLGSPVLCRALVAVAGVCALGWTVHRAATVR
jgi:RsiW-degrading membrane proteinase PrsW (M82 family)